MTIIYRIQADLDNYEEPTIIMTLKDINEDKEWQFPLNLDAASGVATAITALIHSMFKNSVIALITDLDDDDDDQEREHVFI